VLQVWNDSVLALGNNGLYEYAQGAWTPVLVDGDSPALSVAAVGDDRLAMADRAGSSLYLWADGEPRPQRRAVAMGRANCMSWDAQRLWIGTDRGLLRWDGDRLERFVWDDDADNRIAALLVHRGVLYVGSAHGVWRASTQVLDGPRDTGLESLGQRDGLLEGLPNLQVTSMAVHEGDVWVGTQSGLAVLE
jgi:ligand-binding sensor domain-containing protein